jgi:hypothetical protein
MAFSFDLVFEALLFGVLLGCFYAAVSIGLSVSFGLLDVPHVAHPAVMILGSYATYLVAAQGIDPIVAGVVLMPAFFLVRDAVLSGEGGDTFSLVSNFVNAVCSAIEAHPWFPYLWVREWISEGGALRDVMITRVAGSASRAAASRAAAGAPRSACCAAITRAISTGWRW